MQIPFQLYDIKHLQLNLYTFSTLSLIASISKYFQHQSLNISRLSAFVSHYYFFVQVLSSAISNVQISRINLMSPSFSYYCKTNYAKPLLRVPLSHPSRCPALAPFAINLVHCSLPVRNYGFQSRRILFPRASHSFDLLASRSFSF